MFRATKDLFRMVFIPMKFAGKFLFFSLVFKKKTGSKLLKSRETKKFLSPYEKGLLLDGKENRLSISESFQNVCYIARVGAGKTTKYIIPNVLDKATKNCSMVINDPKGEVCELTSGYLKKRGYEIVVFSPNDIKNSLFFNPLEEAQNEIELEQIAETLIWAGNPGDKDPFWNNGACRVISALLKMLKNSDPKNFNLPNLYYLLQNFGEMGESLESWVSRNCWNPDCPEDRYLLNEWKGILTGNTKAIQSYISVCLTALKALTNRQLQGFFSKSDYKLENLRKKKTAIFFITPPEHQKYFSFVTSLFFRSVFNECMRNEHLSGKSLPVYILYDEFGNSYIPDFVSVANTIRGYGVSLSIILQSISQLSMRYGKETAEAIQGAFNTNIALSSSDPETARFFSELCGRVRERNLRDAEKNFEDYREYNLLNSDDVRTIEENETLIISKNRYPVKLEILPYYQNRKFLRYSKFKKPNFKKYRRINITWEDLT